jgi:predicted DsbA family dithiol-disulfide isomerase
MQIDFISDTVCPWCFVGKRRLARAIAARPNIIFDVRYRPYRLDTSIPREGYDRKAYMRAKFGEDPKRVLEMHKLLMAEGEKEGIAFDFGAIARAPNTLDSHRLIRWAHDAGVADDVVEKLFIAYFENGEDISDIRVLADIADLCGMNGGEVADMLESDADLAMVEREEKLAHEMGVTGVPAMLFANKIAVSGAREPEVLVSVIDKAVQMVEGVEESAPDDQDEEE